MTNFDEVAQKHLQKWFEKVLPSVTTPDFPIKGVNFIDIFPLLAHQQFEDMHVIGLPDQDLIFVPEARGFLFYGLLGPDRCIPMRKNNKLPGECVRIAYSKEYGKDSISYQTSAIIDKLKARQWPKDKPVSVCYFDDVLATGGSAQAAIDAINSIDIDGYTLHVDLAYFYIEIDALKGRDKLPCKTFSIYHA